MNEKTYQVKLEEDIKKSQEQTEFYINQLSELNYYYSGVINEKDQLIRDLTRELEAAKKDLTNTITERNINKELQSFRTNFFRFGIDLYFTGGLPINMPVSVLTMESYSIGFGLNGLVMNKINLRGNIGIEYRNAAINPEIGLSIGYYF